jgi:hypothetical protein
MQGDDKMSIVVEKKQNLISVVYRRVDWQWPDFYNAISQVQTILDSAASPVDLLINMEDGHLMGSALITQLQKLESLKRHPSVRQVVVAGVNSFNRALYAASNPNLPPGEGLRFAASLEHAHSILSAEEARVSGKPARLQTLLAR